MVQWRKCVKHLPGKCEELSLNLQPLGVEAQACKPLLLGVGEGGAETGGSQGLEELPV